MIAQDDLEENDNKTRWCFRCELCKSKLFHLNKVITTAEHVVDYFICSHGINS
jgi:hypothetical protein